MDGNVSGAEFAPSDVLLEAIDSFVGFICLI